MEISSLKQNKKDKRDFVKKNFQNEFTSILAFISELSEAPYVYLNIKEIDDNNKSIDYKLGFSTSITDDLLSLIDMVVLQNKVHIISNSNNAAQIKLRPLNSSVEPLVFFAGFPIIDALGKVIGSLNIMDLKPKQLSHLQLKIISQSIINIQSIINLKKENNKLMNTLKEREIQFELHNENSTEITYQLDENGIITHVSKNWKIILGHNINTVIGSNFSSFVHPEDLKICRHAIKNLIEEKTFKEEVTYRIRHKDARFIWHSASLKIVKKKEGFYFVGNCRDISGYVESEQKLKEQKDFYITILDRLPTAVAVFDQNGKYTYLNPTAIKNNELRKFIIGKDDFEYAIHTGRSSTFAEIRQIKFLEALESKGLVVWEDEITQANGTIVTHKRKYNPVFNEDGTLEMMVGFGIDITDSIKNKKETLASKQLIQRILENVAVGILVQGPDSQIIKNNKAACEMLGLNQDQLVGKTSFDPHWKVIHPNGTTFKPEDFPVPKAITELKPIEAVVMGVFRPIKNDFVWLLVDAIPVFADNKSLLYIICSFNNITNQINAENELKISNERFLYSNKVSSDVIWDWDLASRKVFYGDGYYEHFGFNLNNTINNLGEHSHLVHPLDKEKTYANINKAILGTSDFWQYEYRHLKSDNTYALVKDTAYIVRNEKGKALRVIGAMKDITKERKLKVELQRSEEQFKGAFKHSAAGMALIDNEGYYIEVNERLVKILGYTNVEMKSLKFQDIANKVDLQKHLIYKEKLDSDKISNFTIEIRFFHKYKTIVWTQMSVSLIKNTETKYYIFQFIDITKRKQIEEENKLLIEDNIRRKADQLDEAKNLYRLLANNTVDLVCLHNLDTTFKYVSPSIRKLLGYTPEELIGHLPVEYFHPTDVKNTQKKLTDFYLNKMKEPVIARFKKKNNRYIWIEIKANLITENGVLTGFQTSSRDITTRKNADEDIKKALIKERKLNDLKTNLVSTISHEFRTPMTTIRTSAELISIYLEGQNFENAIRLQKRVDIITQEIDRIVELMNAVLTLSKEDSGKTNFTPTLIDLQTLCLEIIDKNFSDLKDQRKVNLNVTGKNFLIYADKNLMEYSISNLLNNAFKYSANSGDVILNIISNDSTCAIQVIDNGIGVPKKDLDNLFNTFYRASNTDGIPGTGLGLNIVKNFVEKNNGTVSLQSKLGKGTKVTISFPAQKIEKL